jgi:predicted nucleotidyltransferase
MLEDKYKKQILDICSSRLGEDYKLYLFGSRARGDQEPHSDIDLAINISNNAHTEKLIFLLIEDLEQSTIPFKIDFLDMDKASDVLKQSITSEGILLHG